jgi:DnaJ-class molecular chaperone
VSVKYKDYYKILGVDRGADQKEIRRVYRKLARKFHPDVNPGDKAAEERFKDIQEAYAVLSDPEKRRTYDELGSSWQPGADFSPPPGWRRTRFDMGDLGDLSDLFGGGPGGFSDFFQSIFGGLGGRPRPDSRRRRPTSTGADVEAEIELTLEEIHQGTRKTMTVTPAPGRPAAPKRMTVNIAAGARDNSVVRLAGKGERTHPAGQPGDLYLRIKVRPHPRFKPVGADDIQVEVPVSPWEAALGATIRVPTLDGDVEMRIPAGTQSGSRLRLRGQGLRTRSGSRGDQIVRVRIAVPSRLTPNEKQLLEKLAAVSQFNPRQPERR